MKEMTTALADATGPSVTPRFMVAGADEELLPPQAVNGRVSKARAAVRRRRRERKVCEKYIMMFDAPGSEGIRPVNLNIGRDMEWRRFNGAHGIIQ
ncbi:MAG: hypothetical protein ACP5P4_05870 [Steroidobacteraceae bacterium]